MEEVGGYVEVLSRYFAYMNIDVFIVISTLMLVLLTVCQPGIAK
jgi:hypothetical protein